MAIDQVLYWPIGRGVWDSGNAADVLLVGWNLPRATIVVGAVHPNRLPDLGALSKIAICVCCDCSTDDEPCGGCLRNRCLVEEKVSVVATTTPLPARLLPDKVPTVTIDTKRSYPVLPQDSAFSQVILYERTPLKERSFVLYEHGESREFSASVLSRLSHATAVLDALRQIPLQKKETGECDSTKDYQKISSLRKEAAATRPSLIPEFLVRNSLLLCHIRTIALRLWSSPPQQRRIDTRKPCVVCKTCHGLVPYSLRESHYEAKAQWIANSATWTRLWCEGAVFVLLLLIVTGHTCDMKFLVQIYRTHYGILSSGLQWLENVPIGLKLNESFMEAIGREVQRAWDVHQWAMDWLLEQQMVPLQGAMGISSIVAFLLSGGSAGLLALLFDIYRFLFLHLAIVHWGAQALFAMELRLLRSSWRLFRGKKRNPLRQRTDTMEYDSLQLLLGTVLFVSVTFLWTTVCAYTVFFALIYSISMAIPLLLGCAYQILGSVGWGCLFLRMWRPALFSRDIVLRLVVNADGTTPCTTRLVARPRSIRSIVWDSLLRAPIRTLTAWSCRQLIDDVMMGVPSSQKEVHPPSPP